MRPEAFSFVVAVVLVTPCGRCSPPMEVGVQETDRALLAVVPLHDNVHAGHRSEKLLADASVDYERRLQSVRQDAEKLRELVAQRRDHDSDMRAARLVVRLLDEFDRHGRIRVKVNSADAAVLQRQKQGTDGGSGGVSGDERLPVWFVPVLATGTSLACFIGCFGGIAITKTWAVRRETHSPRRLTGVVDRKHQANAATPGVYDRSPLRAGESTGGGLSRPSSNQD